MSNKKSLKERAGHYASGMKHGVMKENADKAVRGFVKPLAESIKPAFAKLTNSDLADPGLQAGLEFLVFQACAELMFAGSFLASRVPGLDISEEEAKRKLGAGARYIRAYSAERAGDSAAQYAVKYLPVVKSLLWGGEELLAAPGLPALPAKSDLISMLDEIEAEDE